MELIVSGLFSISDNELALVILKSVWFMKTIVCREPYQLSLETRPPPVPRAGRSSRSDQTSWSLRHGLSISMAGAIRTYPTHV